MKKKETGAQKKKKTLKKGVTKKQPPTKSALKKSSTKKVSGVKTTRKRKAKVPLVYAADWQVFYAVNGAVLHTLQDFYNELETMGEDEYLYHKNTGDHFVTWVREVLGDDLCAKELARATTRKKARATLKKNLSRYKL